MKLSEYDKALIFELKSRGLTHKLIASEVGCAHSTVSYVLTNSVADKARKRASARRKEIGIAYIKVNTFRVGNPRRNYSGVKYSNKSFKNVMRHRVYEFKHRGNMQSDFSYAEAVIKVESTSVCYLSGREINHEDASSYNLDHIVPVSKGGTNNLDNMGVASKEANMAKSDLSLEEFLLLCKDVLEYNGYTVTSRE